MKFYYTGGGVNLAVPGPIGGTTPSTAAFTTLTANGATTLTANTTSTSTSTGTLVVTGGIGLSGALYSGTLNTGAISSSAINMNNNALSGVTSISCSANVICGASGEFYAAGRSVIKMPSDGVIAITNNAETDFGRLQFGGTTSSFPALKRSSAILQVRLADDSAFSVLEMGIPKFSGTNTTGSGTALFGSNSPAGTLTAPYTWIQITTSDGSTAYIPAWK